jgi:hypothetical protein
MNSFLSHTILPLRRIWRRFTSDDHKFRLAKRQSRVSGWTYRTFPMEFHRKDYAMILKACRASKQSATSFLQEAALERAHFILQVESLGKRQ